MLNYNMPKIRKKTKSRLLNTYINASGKNNQVRWSEWIFKNLTKR